MGDTAEHHICSLVCFSRPSLLYVAALVPFLVFTIFLSDKFSPFLVSIPILFLSIFLVTFTKKKVIVEENPVQDEPLICDPKNLLEMEVGDELQPVLETVPQNEAAQQIEGGQIHERGVELLDFLSDSESSDDTITSENIELNWVSSNNVDQSSVTSDDSVSDDEDSLIEIALPTQNPVYLNEEAKEKLEANLPDFLPESIFNQQGLVELLAEINEVNEEENLIEIDISMGSIKCSRFEIEL